MAEKRYRSLALVFSLLFLSAGCSEPKSALEQVQDKGSLTVLTRNVATAYYEGPAGPTGIEYDLAKGFADELGVKLDLVVAANVTDVLNQLAAGRADFAAAGLTDTEARRAWARFTPPYQNVTQQVVYRNGAPRPRTMAKLNGRLAVMAKSSHAEQLARLKSELPGLQWTENEELSSEELMSMVSEGSLDYTIADSHELANNQLLYPELRVAFDITPPEPLAWAFPRGADDSLYKAAVDYFNRLSQSGRIEQLIEHYYGHRDKFDYVGTRTYLAHIQERLPSYRAAFQQAALDNGMDWRLLAAMAYQESHWDAGAVSPTGVRGIMMLTSVTAEHLGIASRHDPLASIEGGGRYIHMLLDKLPERIQGPDRLWLALAAYNVGFGHLEDARKITQMRAGNPDSWKDVKANLPLLRRSEWHRRVPHGYARGGEAVRYVENIRSYYDTLVWITAQEAKRTTDGENDALAIAAPAL